MIFLIFRDASSGCIPSDSLSPISVPRYTIRVSGTWIDPIGRSIG